MRLKRFIRLPIVIPAFETVAKPICGKFSTIYKNHFDFRFGFVKFVIVIKQSLDRK